MSDLVPTDMEYFTRAADDADATISEIRELIRAEYNATATVAETRHAISMREAMIRASGVEGKNAEERGAALAVTVAGDAVSCQLRQTLTAAENGLANIRAALETARERRSLAKRRMEYAIACVRREAGE